jgi:Flp pilus assembly pilin Flp
MSRVLDNWLSRLLVWAASEDGQGLTEYALVLALIGLVAVVALTTLGHAVTSVFTTAARSA